MKPRTSQSHPLNIATLDTPGGGRIGMTFCPGKTDPFAMSGPWARDLDTDLAAIQAWGASALVTLVEQHELVHLGVGGLGEQVLAMGLDWYHLPIRDVSIPTAAVRGSNGAPVVRRCASDLLGGQALVVHCRGGLGRTGLIAARLLIELGESPPTALRRVRAARPGAVETPEQEHVRARLRRVRPQLRSARRSATQALLASQTSSRRTVARVMPQKSTCSSRARCCSARGDVGEDHRRRLLPFEAAHRVEQDLAAGCRPGCRRGRTRR